MEKYTVEPYEEQQDRRDYREEEAYLRAKKKVDSIMGFYWHLASYVIVNIFLIIVISVNSDEGFFHFGTFATALFWGIGLLFHFLGVFGTDFLFGKHWEEKKIAEMMEKERENWE
ncbi:2TM domain-containing protein [Winogradskyella vidalii]|uniref:2TM domain-containing protein n=1 Tax=Winogradskyella vidalii TaxID=2615024 RepID=UPI0015C9B9D2|nr:2TM domain-containing protein [Winogradskyella vidalii]